MANRFYDPKKAHEYYMKHRQLKGKKGSGSSKKSNKNRLSTDGLNPAGVEASARAKAEMTVKMNDFNNKLKEELKKQIAELDAKGLDPTEKAIQAQMLKDKFSEVKSQAKKLFTEQYAQQMDAIKANKEYKS